MSRPFPFQRNLSWISRLMYYSSPINQPSYLSPVVSPVIEVGQDWPQQVFPVVANVTSIAGVVASTLLTTPAQKHTMIERWTLTGNFAAGDIILASISGLAASADVAIVSAGFGAAQFAALDMTAGRPLYLPAGWRAFLTIQSVAGGVAFNHNAQVRQIPEVQPLLPLV